MPATPSGSSPTSLAASSIRSEKRGSLNTIESSVTRLLVSTKHLLESLTQWARQEADDKFVSDAYVKLGNDFRSASRAFTSAGVDISDLGDVPQALRIILEAALSEAPSQDNLDRFLPNIRNIIVTLLQNLKAKQAKARSISIEKQLQRQKQSEEPTNHNHPSVVGPTPPLIPTGPGRSITPSSTSMPTPKNRKPMSSINQNSMHEAPGTQNDALAQLQKGDALQRRASKRFSAYQYAKLTNFPGQNGLPNGLPTISSEYNTGSRSSSAQLPSPPKEVSEKTNDQEDSESFIFLKLQDKTKRVDVSLPVTFATIRLLFVEKFAYSPGTASFPDIYIQEPKTGVSYELEDDFLKNIKVGSLLCLNEPDPQTFALKDLEKSFSALNSKVDGLSADITTQIKEAIDSIEIPQPIIPQPIIQHTDTANNEKTKGIALLGEAIKEISSIQQEIKVIRQLQSANKEAITKSVKSMAEKVKDFQESGLDISKSSNREYMESCHTKLSEESDNLLTIVDDLQDIMEALRKDVAQRGVRVGEKQLKNTNKEITDAKTALKRMTDYISKEKSVWKKIWESELDKVCEEQQFFNLQDDLTQDLGEDLKKIEETFLLIEQCSLEQSKQTGTKRNKFMPHLHEPGESLHDLKDAMLNEVAALNPNHEGRLEAIEKAERLRERERQLMKLTKFQEELGEFVDDNKLKKSGGIEELERQRKLKDEENLKSSFGFI